ncbi:unnamed protein product [Lepidochelys kempii]
MLAARLLLRAAPSGRASLHGSARRLRGARVAVVLSGCGVYDGTEIHEASAILVHLSRGGAEVQMYAPDIPQMHVIDHSKGQPTEAESRNVLVESARVARGKITDLAKLSTKDHDAVIFPGGFGAAKNLNADMPFESSISDSRHAYLLRDKATITMECCVNLTKCKEGTNVRFLKIATALDPRFKNLKCLPKCENDEAWSMLSEVLKEQHSDAETTELNHQKRKSTCCWWHLTQIMKMNMHQSPLLWIVIEQKSSSAWMHVLWNGG